MVQLKKKIILGIVFGIVLITIVVCYGLINVMSATDPTTSAMIKTEIPMLTTSNVGFSLNGGLIITAPDNTPGHWESKHGYFTDSNEVEFCFIKTIGINELIFIPDDPNIKASSVHSVVFVWRAHITEIILVLIAITLIIAIYVNTRTSPTSQTPQKEKFTTT